MGCGRCQELDNTIVDEGGCICVMKAKGLDGVRVRETAEQYILRNICYLKLQALEGVRLCKKGFKNGVVVCGIDPRRKRKVFEQGHGEEVEVGGRRIRGSGLDA